MDRLEKNRKQREYRQKNANSCTKKYEKTKKGFLMRLYRNMISRATGIQKKKMHLYNNCYVMPKDAFYEWAINSERFHSLFTEYELSGYQRKFAPSVDRINSNGGYTFDNIEWVTMSENSRRGAINKRYKKRIAA